MRTQMARMLPGTSCAGRAAATLRADRSARLRVAASLTVAEYLMPRWLLLLRRAHPDLETAVEVVNSHAVLDHVRSGAVDVGFVESPEPRKRSREPTVQNAETRVQLHRPPTCHD